MMEWIVLLRFICELFVTNRQCTPVRFIVRASEPVLVPVRKLLSAPKGKKARMDLSPLVAMILLYLIHLAMKQLLL